MPTRLLIAALVALVTSSISHKSIAAVPTVVTDIPPIHSLVSQVMGKLGDPYLLLRSGTSPHDYALRPSDANAVRNSTLVFWAGESLTPWLSQLVKNMDEEIVSIELIKSAGTKQLSLRSGVLFQHYESNEMIDDIAADYSGTDYDPHAWLDPGNATTWLTAIATALASQDPKNASTYYSNASAGIESIKQLVIRIKLQIRDSGNNGFIVFHDAYQYFEYAFGVFTDGAVSLSDGIRPSASRIADIRNYIENNSIRCVLVEPQYNKNLVSNLLSDTATHLVVADPLGMELLQGAGLYLQLIQRLADSINECIN